MSLSGLSKTEKRLISIAAAIAAGCIPCTAVAIRHARDVGASEEDIQSAVTLGLEVKRKACDEIQLEAQKHLDINTIDSSPNEITGKTKTDWLIATGAAFAANSTAGFERYSSAAEQLGVAENELKMVVETARYIKEQAGRQVDKIATMVTPIELKQKAVSGRCGCSTDGKEKSTSGCS